MADFLRQAPLDRLSLQARAKPSLAGAGLGLGEIRLRGIVNLRVRQDDPAARQTLESALASSLPAINATAKAQELTLMGLGPDEWLAVGADGPAIAQRLRQATQGHFVAVTDVSENYATLVVAGPAARSVLAKGCPLDFHPTRFRVGQLAQSLVAKATTILELVSDGPEGAIFFLLCRRSFAEYLFLWLEDAGKEYGTTVIAA